MANLERIYTIPLGAMYEVVRQKRGKRAVKFMKEFAVRHMGPERVLFGSDAPGRSFGVQLGKVLGADLTPDQRDLVLFGNAERMLRR